MATLNNPFVVYGYKGAEYFCDRQKETEKMISTLHNERNITLVYGQDGIDTSCLPSDGGAI